MESVREASRLARRIALGSALLDVLLVAAKLTAGLLTGSLGLIGDAVHSSLDMVSGALAYWAIVTARRPPDREHPFGHDRAENLAAYTEGLLLVGAAGVITFEAVQRLIDPVRVDPAPFAFAVLIATILIETGRFTVLGRAGRRLNSAALLANSQNRRADLLAALAALAGLLGVRLGLNWADSVAAIVVAAVILSAAGRLVLGAGDTLIDRSAASAEAQLKEVAAAVPGVREVISARVRSSGSRYLGEVTVAGRRTLTLEGVQGLAGKVRSAVRERLPNLDLVVQVAAYMDTARYVERVHAAAAHQGDVRDLHDVEVERETDGGLHVSLHAKLPAEVTLEEAGRVEADLKRLVELELGPVARFDVHFEPLEPDITEGEDVTAARPELLERIRAAAEAEAGSGTCRDIELSAREHGISVYVVLALASRLSLREAHQVETGVETAIRRQLPELREVMVRAVPVAGPPPNMID